MTRPNIKKVCLNDTPFYVFQAYSTYVFQAYSTYVFLIYF